MADAKRVDAGSGIAGIADVLKLFGGSKASSTTSSDTSALQGVLGDLKSQDPAKLLQTIFTQAGGQIPGLQAAMSNAVGARSGGNSAVNAILQKLLQQTTLLGQQQLVDQQQKNLQTQVQAADAIARGNTTTKQKSGTDLSKAATTLGLLSAGNKLLNSDFGEKAKNLFSGITDGIGSTASNVASVAPSLSFAAPADYGPVTSGVSSGVSDFTDLASNTGDLFSGVGDLFTTSSQGGGSLFDFFGGSDGMAYEVPATFDGVDEVASTVADSGSWWDDITSFFGFADGGLVGRDNPRGYAEGGIVRSGGGRRSSAPTFELPAIERSVARTASPAVRSNIVSPRVSGKTGKLEDPIQDSGGTEQEASTVGNSANAMSLGQALGIAAMGLTGNVPGMAMGMISAANPTMGAIGKAGLTAMNPTPIGVVSSLLGLINAINASSPSPSSSIGGLSSASDNTGFGTNSGGIAGDAGYGLGGTNASLGQAGNTGFSGGVGLGLGNFGGIGAGIGSSIGNSGFGESGSGGPGAGDGSAGSSGDSGAGNSGGVGEGGSSGSGEGGDAGVGGGEWKHGGKITGPGTSRSDSIPAMLSHGEYVIPADVVQKMGIDFFDSLKANFHKQAA